MPNRRGLIRWFSFIHFLHQGAHAKFAGYGNRPREFSLSSSLPTFINFYDKILNRRHNQEGESSLHVPRMHARFVTLMSLVHPPRHVLHVVVNLPGGGAQDWGGMVALNATLYHGTQYAPNMRILDPRAAVESPTTRGATSPP